MKRIIIEVPEEYHKMIKIEAAKQDITIRILVLRALAVYLQCKSALHEQE